MSMLISLSLQWRHHEHDGVSNQKAHDCLPNRLFRRRSMKTSKLRVTGLWVGNSPVTGEFPAQRASNVETNSIWWRHHAKMLAYHRHARNSYSVTARAFWTYFIYCPEPPYRIYNVNRCFSGFKTRYYCGIMCRLSSNDNWPVRLAWWEGNFIDVCLYIYIYIKCIIILVDYVISTSQVIICWIKYLLLPYSIGVVLCLSTLNGHRHGMTHVCSNWSYLCKIKW